MLIKKNMCPFFPSNSAVFVGRAQKYFCLLAQVYINTPGMSGSRQILIILGLLLMINDDIEIFILVIFFTLFKAEQKVLSEFLVS